INDGGGATGLAHQDISYEFSHDNMSKGLKNAKGHKTGCARRRQTKISSIQKKLRKYTRAGPGPDWWSALTQRA
ncbi:MAG TPA: hypothetical protein VNU49_05200, partial [Opitutaceae bacterium]|nr:hypothetical protein [Opitutaceae bacterium]